MNFLLCVVFQDGESPDKTKVMKKVLIVSLGWMLCQHVLAEVSPQLISFSCRNCHASHKQGMPDLDLLSVVAIKQALLDFKYDKRQSTVMGRIAKGFSDSEIADVAQVINQAD